MLSESTLDEIEQKTDSLDRARSQLDKASALMATAIALAADGRLTGISALKRMTGMIFRLTRQTNDAERKLLKEPLEKLVRLTDIFHALMEERFAYLCGVKNGETDEGND